MPNCLVHITSPSAHRQEYHTLFVEVLDIAPSAELTARGGLRDLIAVIGLMFATQDKDTRSFALVALVRALLGRWTARTLLFLRPQACLAAGIKARPKRRLFGALKSWLHINLVPTMLQDFAMAQR